LLTGGCTASASLLPISRYVVQPFLGNEVPQLVNSGATVRAVVIDNEFLGFRRGAPRTSSHSLNHRESMLPAPCMSAMKRLKATSAIPVSRTRVRAAQKLFFEFSTDHRGGLVEDQFTLLGAWRARTRRTALAAPHSLTTAVRCIQTAASDSQARHSSSKQFVGAVQRRCQRGRCLP
jgi:hypothetical protein